MLSKEDCQRYVGWGMKLKWYCKTVDAQTGKTKIKHYQSPSLEEQLAFAVEKAKELFVDFSMLRLYYRNKENDWSIIIDIIEAGNSVVANLDHWSLFSDPDPQQAVFKLQEYMENK